MQSIKITANFCFLLFLLVGAPGGKMKEKTSQACENPSSWIGPTQKMKPTWQMMVKNKGHIRNTSTLSIQLLEWFTVSSTALFWQYVFSFISCNKYNEPTKSWFVQTIPQRVYNVSKVQVKSNHWSSYLCDYSCEWVEVSQQLIFLPYWIFWI